MIKFDNRTLGFIFMIFPDLPSIRSMLLNTDAQCVQEHKLIFVLFFSIEYTSTEVLQRFMPLKSTGFLKLRMERRQNRSHDFRRLVMSVINSLREIRRYVRVGFVIPIDTIVMISSAVGIRCQDKGLLE
jgi:hypothetical protein